MDTDEAGDGKRTRVAVVDFYVVFPSSIALFLVFFFFPFVFLYVQFFNCIISFISKETSPPAGCLRELTLRFPPGGVRERIGPNF